MMARTRSPSPPVDYPLASHSAGSPQPLVSKRDKRRTMLADKLGDMIASFSDNRDLHWRAQLAAIQADMNLIMKADPYANKPLEDTGEEAAELAHSVIGAATPLVPSAQGDYVAQVGRYYSRFVDSVNDALEERDIGLTMLWNKYQASLHELRQTHEYKVRLASEEHRHLANTIRERLVASISSKRNKLLREKEHLDIADSNALLLHPNQYSITNPASPGGAQSSRKTRGARHRIGDPDDITQENKRKRKAAFDENDNGSPAPAGKAIDIGVGSPFRDAKSRTINTQFEAPAYSIDRLFTERELAMNMNTAALATSHFFRTLNGNSQETNGVNGDHADGEDSSTPAGVDGDAADDDATPAAPEMTRSISHATRGATRNLALGDLTEAARRTLPFVANLPVILPANIGSKPNATAPTPSSLPNADIDQDLMLMARDAPPDDALNQELLERAVQALRTREYQLQPPNAGGSGHQSGDMTSNFRGTGTTVLPPHIELAMGGVPMSAQSSMGGYSDAGVGAPNPTGSSMRRTASGAGWITTEGSGRRRGRGV